MSDTTGGCYCGAVRYRFAQHKDSGICYCANCRKAIGAQSVAWVGVTRGGVELIQGEPKRYAADNGSVWSFCGQCGSTLFWENEQRDAFAVTTGSLDDPASFPPQGSSWDEERLPWSEPLANK